MHQIPEAKEETVKGRLQLSTSKVTSDPDVSVQVFYDINNDLDISNDTMLQLLPSKYFSVPNDQYTFAELLFEVTGHWNISRGAIKT